MKWKTKQAVSLAVIALVATIVWRLEVQAYPQGGWDFVAYTHWAIPFGVGLFLLWLAVFVPVKGFAKRIALVMVTAAGAAVWYPLLQSATLRLFSLNFGDSFISRLHDNLIYILIPMTPVLFAGLLRCFCVKPKALQIAFAVLLYVAAWPISLLILRFFPSYVEGFVDAVKTGLVIPFLIVGLGVLAFPPEVDSEGCLATDKIDEQSLSI